MRKCPKCGARFIGSESYCYDCDVPLIEVPVTGGVAANSAMVHCPHCGSTQIHSDKRGWSLSSGFFGANKIYITCLACGHKWKAGT